jgi:hypothetical protein
MKSAAQTTSAPYTLTLSSKQPEFRVGSNVWITIVQTNTSKQVVECVYRGSNGVNNEYHYDVWDEDGKLAEKAIWPHMDTTPNDYHDCGINPGESSTDVIKLSRVYKLDRPGKYVVQVYRFDPDLPDDQGNPLKVLSNTITITVVAADPAPDATK